MTSYAHVTGHIDELRRTHWRPELRAGHFFIKDREYYLYAQKRTLYVLETQELRIQLAGRPVRTSMQVWIEGEPWSNWRIEGHEVVVSLEGIEGSAAYWGQLDWDYTVWDFFKSSAELLPENTIRLSYEFLRWNPAVAPTGQKFDTYSVDQYTRIGDAEIVNRLPDDYVAGAPVIVTDDEKQVWDGREEQIQFRVTEPKRYIDFNMKENLVHNPHFARGVTGVPSSPAAWYRTDPTGAMRHQTSGYVGHYATVVYPTGRVVQEVPITGGQPAVAQTWVRGSGVALLELAFRDGSGIVDTGGSVLAYSPAWGAYSFRKQLVLTNDWQRLGIVLGQGTDFDPTDALFPDICDALEVRLGALSGYAEFGAVSVHADQPRLTQYFSVSPTGTVEYETDPTGLYIHRPTGVFPWEEEWQVDANAVNDENHGGFLVITEDAEPVDLGLGIGAMTNEEPALYGSTGYPQGIWPWPSGVRHEFGRRHLPYGKVSGWQKLRQRVIFDLENSAPSLFEVTEPRSPRVPKDVFLGSPANMYRGSDGLPRLVYTLGRNRSEYITAIFWDNYGNPIVHDWISISTNVSGFAIDPTGAYTNRGGRVVAHFSGVAPSGLANPSGQVTFTHRDSGVEGIIDIETV